MLTLNEQAAKVIKSLMRELRVSDHLVMPNGAIAINANTVVERLEGAHIGDGTADAALAIGEDAFRAGYEAAAKRALAFYPTKLTDWQAHLEQAWSDYDPPEHIKDLA